MIGPWEMKSMKTPYKNSTLDTKIALVWMPQDPTND